MSLFGAVLVFCSVNDTKGLFSAVLPYENVLFCRVQCLLNVSFCAVLPHVNVTFCAVIPV